MRPHNRHSSGPSEGDSKINLESLRNFDAWKAFCDQILADPFPPPSSDTADRDIDLANRVSFSKFSNWEIICQEILDTEFTPLYYQKCHEELGRRGKSAQEIFEMRRLAWYTAGWLNFPMMLWEWVHLDESDIFRAIEWLYERNQISGEERIEFENLVKLYAS